MKTHIRLAVVIMVTLFSATLAYADPTEWKIDPVHTSIYFSIHHIFATVRGKFDDFSGTLIFDPKDHMVSRCDMDVKTDSIDTGNQQRDNDLRSKRFFDTSDYPLMTFRTRKVRHIKANRYEISGSLTVKGVTKDVTIPFRFLGVKDNPLKPKTWVAGFEARFTIKRLAYHVGTGQFFKMGAIGNDVEVVVTMEAAKAK